jgi:hypothetical protein
MLPLKYVLQLNCSCLHERPPRCCWVHEQADWTSWKSCTAIHAEVAIHCHGPSIIPRIPRFSGRDEMNDLAFCWFSVRTILSKLRSVLEILFLYSRRQAVCDICGVASHARLVRNFLHSLCYISWTFVLFRSWSLKGREQYRFALFYMWFCRNCRFLQVTQLLFQQNALVY